jgi:hypothetical protein
MADSDPSLVPVKSGPSKPPNPNDNADIGLQFPRRGTKRPVAADFVDFEQSPRNSNMNGGSYSTQRRKTQAGFASVSEMRRCVIDLSDSEDDGVAEPVTSDYSASNQEPKVVLVARRLTPAAAISSGSGSSTPASTLAPAVTMTTLSPAALTEKEQEIRRMKELIREREERGRMKRLVSVRPNLPSTRVRLNRLTGHKYERVQSQCSEFVDHEQNFLFYHAGRQYAWVLSLRQ